AKNMQRHHQNLIADLKDKEKIRIVFLVIHASVWKIDSVFKRMLEDPFFEPEILVCPYIAFGENRMLEDMEQAYTYFKGKNYSVRKALKNDGSWLKIEELKPDIVFFTNPHDLTIPEYYKYAYMNYLSCYVPYHHEVGSYMDDIDQYDQLFHNTMWLIFSPHTYSYEIFRNISQAKGENVFVTGYPMLEESFGIKNSGKGNFWKNNDKRLRVIWAPHHTIDSPELPYSNFLKYAEDIQQLSLKYKDSIVWSFKPHPILKSKLYEHPQWGKHRTDTYYSFWEKESFTQLDLGEYIDLFAQSDAMIHDSGSFLAEYLYFNKPVLYIMAEENNLNFFNDFGKKALKSCRIATNLSEIEMFITGLVNHSIKEITDTHADFYNQELKIYFNEQSPSEKIICKIKQELNYDL
uniref:CDP-glycerol glycerophosphotransferase family protein n=1 Tax=Kordiimonas sp. TaxID=1970157 RepID=UPI003A93963C